MDHLWSKFWKIIAEPPEDISKLDLKLIIERDGEIIVKDLSIDLAMIVPLKLMN